MNKQFCPYCMTPITEGEACPSCGLTAGSYTPNRNHLPPGTILNDRYLIGRSLGSGGFGITYIGCDLRLELKVAIKEYFPTDKVQRISDVSLEVSVPSDLVEQSFQNGKERFLDEARVMARMDKQPEIVSVRDFFECNNTAYIVMEYVRGMDLAKYIAMKGGRLSPDETFRILRPIMEALAKVHKGGIVHRDISPDNIILDPMGGAKLLDFGAVRAVEDPDVDKGLNKSTEAILKQGFAPIEQYNTRGSLGPWTDEYALCATVWYCLTGTVPTEVSLRMAEGIDPDWSTIEGLPAHQQKALEKGFSCRAKDRYKSIDELLADLFPEETAQAAPEPAKEAPVERAAKKAKAPEKSGKKFWTVFTTAILALWLVLAVLIPKEIKTGSEEPVPQESAPAQIQTQPTQPIETEPPTVPLSPEEEAYLQAEALLDEGKLGEAAIAFGKLAGYADARERSFAVWDMIAVRDTISAGGWHTVGLKADGTLVAAGDNLGGRCDVKSWTDIVAVSAGAYHTVGLKADGTLVAVGNNDHGRCDVKSWTDIVAVSAGNFHTVGLKADGTVVAVGYNEYGQGDVEDWTNIVAVSAGYYHTVGLKADGTVVATVVSSPWNDYGQSDVGGWTTIVSVSAGWNHTVGLRADGTVVAVGDDSYGQCDVKGWTDIVVVSAGYDFTVGLKSDGTLVAVGHNNKSSTNGYEFSGQCDVEGWTDIVAVSAGTYHTVGVTAGGTVVAVGDNDYGQCGMAHWAPWTDIQLPKERVPFR